jgi:hypothetical protein
VQFVQWTSAKSERKSNSLPAIVCALIAFSATQFFANKNAKKAECGRGEKSIEFRGISARKSAD